MLQPSFEPPDAGWADHAACRALICDGSKSFFAASKVLPSEVCQPAYALYAFCRVADDAVDLDGGEREAVERLRMRLDRAYEGRPLPDPVDRAFACVVYEYALPRALPEALLEGLAWDAEGRRYDDLAGVYAYSARVAGAVGAMMAVLMGAREPAVVARACDLGVAMQLTNIARDVADDAREGRLYLPRAWMEEAGLDPDGWLAEPFYDARLRRVVRRLLACADGLYERAAPGIDALPSGCRPGIHAARRIYREIGRAVEAQDCDPSRGRAVVSTRRKVQLLAGAFADCLAWSRRPIDVPALAEVSFLVDAVAAAPAPVRSERQVGIDGMVNVIHAMAERDRAYRIRTTRGYALSELAEAEWTASSS
jgi:15-cis-phytoene synthase